MQNSGAHLVLLLLFFNNRPLHSHGSFVRRRRIPRKKYRNEVMEGHREGNYGLIRSIEIGDENRKKEIDYLPLYLGSHCKGLQNNGNRSIRGKYRSERILRASRCHRPNGG